MGLFVSQVLKFWLEMALIFHRPDNNSSIIINRIISMLKDIFLSEIVKLRYFICHIKTTIGKYNNEVRVEIVFSH